MAKKKSIELVHEALVYEEENCHFQVLRFYPDSMRVDIKALHTKSAQQRIAFAHLPKNIKQRIKPN